MRVRGEGGEENVNNFRVEASGRGEKGTQAVCSRKGWPGMQAPLVLPQQGGEGRRRRGERRTRRGGEEEAGTEAELEVRKGLEG